MGNACKENIPQSKDPLKWQYHEDSRQKNVYHSGDLKCSNEESQKILADFQKRLQSSKKMFKDNDMPSDPICLKSATKQIRCTYERPYKFLEDRQEEGKYKIIDHHEANPDTIEVRDEIMQYFGVFLCFLSDKPNLIQKIILTNQNTFGIHAIRAYKDGHVKEFPIDDYILCENGKPMFSQPCKDMYMWPCLIQRAWFKMRGFLSKKLHETTPQQVFQTFAPLPIQKFHLSEGMNSTANRDTLEDIFSNFQTRSSKNKSFILTSKKNPKHDLGLLPRKHFYLLYTFTHENKRLFYIRNPCGQFSFRGVYSDIPEEINRVIFNHNFVNIAAGNFVMDEEEFLEQFGEIMVVHYLPGNKINNMGFKCDNQQQFFLGFKLKYKGNLNLRVTQNYMTGIKNQGYFPLMYHLLRLSDEDLIGGKNNLKGCFGVKHTYLLDNFCEDMVPGEYLIRLKKKQLEKNLQGINHFISSYFPENINFDIKAQEEMGEKWKNYLLKEGKKRLNISESKGRRTDINHIVFWIGDIAAIYVEKANPKKKQVKIEVNFPELMNLQCTSHPQVSKSSEWHEYEFENNFLFIFQKISLTAQTQIRQYHLDS